MSSILFFQQVRQNYMQRKLGYYGVLLLGVLLVLAAILYQWPYNVIIWLFCLGGLGAFLLWAGFQLYGVVQITPAIICRHLNRTHPELEESCQLFLLPPDRLTLLEQMQRQRIQPYFNQLNSAQITPVQYRQAWYILISCLAAAGLLFLLKSLAPKAPNATAISAPAMQTVRKILPQVQQITIRVVPPPYTQRQPYRVSTPSFKAEEGALITWEIKTTGPVNTLQLSGAGKKNLNFKPTPEHHNQFTFSLRVTQPFIYTINLNNQKSEYYAVTVIKDQPPRITVQNPGAFTAVAFGDPQIIPVRATITDDYRLQNVDLVATIAQGSGENVKFKQVNLPLHISANENKTSFQARQSINLRSLGLTYGDELYFYLQAQDNNRGYTRTESFLIQLEDTTVTTDFDGLAMGLNTVPTYFRSQRQLIIDTEKLISKSKSLDKTAFQDRSQNLGEEQKILRLRYGKFLGEEYETNAGANPAAKPETHSDDDGHDHGNQSSGNALAPFIHRHNNEEEATYFEPAIKVKLKAALAQMWEAELRLRLHQPRQALPFEYKALRLLKDVQQSSRVYVRKTGFPLPPLKEAEKRLTGDLTQVNKIETQTKKEAKNLYPASRQALTWLLKQTEKQNYDAKQATLLQQAGPELAAAALQEPDRYLTSLQDLRTIISQMQTGQPLCQSCLQTLIRAFSNLLPPPVNTPAPTPTYRHALAEKYFQNIK